MQIKLCVAVLLLLAVANAVDPQHRFMSRRRRAFSLSSGTKLDCGDKADEKKVLTAMAGFNFGTDNPLIDWDSTNQKFTWKSGVKSNVDASTLSGDVAYGDVDLCKKFPQTVCKQDDWANPVSSGSKNFCKLSSVSSAKLCCPLSGSHSKKFAKTGTDSSLFQNTGCAAAGMPRSFMPQIENESTFLSWYSGKFSKDITPASTGTTTLDKIIPSQDEIFIKNSVMKVCGASVKGTTAVPLSICQCDADISGYCFILDGHHRYSQMILCHATTGCTDAAQTIPTREFKESCATLIGNLVKELDYSANTGKTTYSGWGTTQRDLKSLDAGANVGQTDVKNGFYFKAGAFVELEARFGRSAHQSEVEAGKAYVEQTRAYLSSIGLSLKGGDDALHRYWRERHAPNLWGSQDN